jgi:Fe-S oxidoreductase
MALKPFHLSKTFLTERCDHCGLCFHECPVVAFPLDRARTEIKKLIETGRSDVLKKCTGCMACNSICPQDANPHTLIVNQWSERYRREGLPYRAGLVLPCQEGGLFSVGQRVLPPEEQALVRQWEANWRSPGGHDTMIYAGCNMIIQPFLMEPARCADVPVFGSLDLCCGEPFYRMGCWDMARAAALHVSREFTRMGLKRVIVPCLACYHLFKVVYPNVLDVNLRVDVVSIEEWLYDRVAKGVIGVSPLNKTAVIQDNCWPKASGGELFQKVRDLLSLLGVTVVEPAYTREKALCCGMCAGAARFRLTDIWKTAHRLLEELEKVPADIVVDYCGGCNWLLSMISHGSVPGRRKERYHILELVQLATGGTPKRRTDQQTWNIIRALAPTLIARYPRRKRLWLNEASIGGDDRTDSSGT